MSTFSQEGFYVAFDTSGQVASVAVAKGAQVLARTTLERQGDQAARLVPSIRDILSEAGVDRSEISGVIVGEGPGSFTGVRIAAATADAKNKAAARQHIEAGNALGQHDRVVLRHQTDASADRQRLGRGCREGQGHHRVVGVDVFLRQIATAGKGRQAGGGDVRMLCVCG